MSRAVLNTLCCPASRIDAISTLFLRLGAGKREWFLSGRKLPHSPGQARDDRRSLAKGEDGIADHVFPWWLGYFFAGPIRRWLSENPEELLQPYVRPGTTVLGPGPGMGFFTLPLARMVGPSGRVVAVDIQPQMLRSLRRRAEKLQLASRIETRLAGPDRLGLEDLRGTADFALAFAVIHEVPSASSFFCEVAAALKSGGTVLFAEPAGHVKTARFEEELSSARAAGLEVVSRPTVRRSHAELLRKP